PDGRISLPLLNDVEAAGLTPMELRDVLLKRLAEYVAAPEVSVIVTEVNSFRISVLGEVAKPGRFELKSAVRLVDALAMAGGLTQYASRSNIVVLRPGGHGLEAHRFDYDKLRAADARSLNFFLQPDDVLLVPCPIPPRRPGRNEDHRARPARLPRLRRRPPPDRRAPGR